MIATRIIDGDGHIMEDMPAIAQLLPEPYRTMSTRAGGGTRGLFPGLDNMHTVFRDQPAVLEGRGRVEVPGWLEFMPDVGIESAVLYPSGGLGVGRIPHPEVAVAVCRVYNDWLYQTYVAADKRFKGMALIPLQDPQAAVEELRRAVKEYGFVGAMLPTNGLKDHLGAGRFWPVYEEADRLHCAMAAHGGSHNGLGLDQLDYWPVMQGLGHPFGLAVGFAGIVSNGLLDKFPNVRFGFLEGGIGWLLMCVERFSEACSTFSQHDPNGRFYTLRPGENMPRYLQRHMDDGRIFVGCEGDEPGLARLVDEFGNGVFVYSSDFPHEVTKATCKHELEELIENEHLTPEDKEAILHGNAERLYGLS